MNKRVIVVDANVVVKWFVNEEGSEEAERLLREALYGRMELHSPCLLLFEAASALRKYAVNGYISGEHARKSVEKLLETPLRIWGIQELPWAETVKLSVKHGITLYDASYLALARKLDTVLITADEKLHQQATKIMPGKTTLLQRLR